MIHTREFAISSTDLLTVRWSVCLQSQVSQLANTGVLIIDWLLTTLKVHGYWIYVYLNILRMKAKQSRKGSMLWSKQYYKLNKYNSIKPQFKENNMRVSNKGLRIKFRRYKNQLTIIKNIRKNKLQQLKKPKESWKYI